jgi:hypothetical protein
MVIHKCSIYSGFAEILIFLFPLKFSFSNIYDIDVGFCYSHVGNRISKIWLFLQAFDENGSLATPESRQMAKQHTLKRAKLNSELQELNKILEKKEKLASQMAKNENKVVAMRHEYEVSKPGPVIKKTRFDACYSRQQKTLWQRKKLLQMSNFFLCHNLFNIFCHDISSLSIS